MQIYDAVQGRQLKRIDCDVDLVVVGGGLAGTCCAITAARAGVQVALVQDRPVLGGNASSEVRLWTLGATSHMGNNNRWSREGGVIDELLVENLYRNPEGNPVIFDTVLLEKVRSEPNITLLLNTSVHDIEKSDGHIRSARAFCSQNSTEYRLCAPLFCDASGDGVVGFLAGAAFRIGAESRMEFGEQLAPREASNDQLGHSLYFYTRDTGRPVRFVPPKYALDDITKIPRYRQFNTQEHGCQLWWIEYGGIRDTVHDTEEIKWELWKIVYGVWNMIKNSGRFPEAETLTLEWVGAIPGKRESRRFEGDYMLIQQDIVMQHTHYDAVSYGGWAIDLHPSEGIYSDLAPCTHWHSKGVYQVPYRTMYSRNVPNLFLTGRIISASHTAFGSIRVMATCAHNAQAVGLAAALCTREGILPRDVAHPSKVVELQQELLRVGQHIPGLELLDESDLARTATATASSEFQLSSFPPNGDYVCLDQPHALIVPLEAGTVPEFNFIARASEQTTLECQLRTCSRIGNFTPDVVLESITLSVADSSEIKILQNEHQQLHAGHKFTPVIRSRNGNGDHGGARQTSMTATKPRLERENSSSTMRLAFNAKLQADQYAFICLMANPLVEVALSDRLCTGVVTVSQKHSKRVATSSKQNPPPGSGIDTFEFWVPERRPKGKNLAFQSTTPVDTFAAKNTCNGFRRPGTSSNAWVAAIDDPTPSLTLKWDEPQAIKRIELVLDTDLDHAMETVLMQHYENVSPFCVREYRILDGNDQLLFEERDNHQTRNVVILEKCVLTDTLKIELVHPSQDIPASIYEVRCYSDDNPT
ncbi:FAD-dependent oxidoreductase [Aeoliella sp.]|uniref:FAD-dependent oxidoreductase n=1 Tax=Aeoliella sp. TaxID=2795800 RepID=UPI003CCB916C